MSTHSVLHSGIPLQEIFAQAPHGIAIYRGPDHVIESVNATMLRYLGKTEAELIGQPLFDAIPEIQDTQFPAIFAEVYCNGIQYNSEESIVTLMHQGKPINSWFRIAISPLRNDLGEIYGVLGMAADITEQVCLREQLLHTREELSIALEVGKTGTWRYDLQSGHIVWSRELYKLLGVAEDSFSGTYEEWRGLVHPDDLEQTEAVFYEALKGDTELESEFRIICPDGSVKWLVSRCKIHYRADGKPDHILGINADITTLRLRETEVRELLRKEQISRSVMEAERERMYGFFRELPAAVAVYTGPDFVFEFVNKAYERLAPPRAESVRGMKLLDAYPYARDTGIYSILQDVWNNPRVLAFDEHLFLLPNKEFSQEYYINFILHPWYNHAGCIEAIVTFAVDVTPSVKARKQLEAKESAYRTLADNCPDLITRHGRDYRYLFVNPAIEAITGIAKECFPGKSYRELGLEASLCQFLDRELAYVFEQARPSTAIYTAPETGNSIQSHFVPEFDEKEQVSSVLVFSRDISEMRKAEQEIRYKAQLLSKISDAIISTDEYLNVISWNEGAERIYGFPASEVINRPLRSILHTEIVGGTIDESFNMLQKNGFWTGEVVQLDRHGNRIHVLSTVSSVRNEGGTTIGYVAINHNISRRKEAEQELLKSELRYRSLILATNNIIWITDENGAFVEPQQMWEEYTGQSWADHQGFGWVAMIHPDDHSTLLRYWQEAVDAAKPYEHQGRLWCARYQDYRHFSVRAIPILDGHGHILEWIGSVKDIHDQVLANHAIIRSEESMRKLADSMPQLVWIAAPDGRVYYYNKRLDEYLGAAVNDTGEYEWAPLLHPDDADHTTWLWQSAVKTGTEYEAEHRIRMKDGSYRWHLSRGFPELDVDGQVTRWFGTATDIDALKQAEARIQIQNSKLEEAIHEFRIVTDFMPQLVWASYADTSEGTYFQNRKWEEYTGRPLADLKGGGWMAVLHPDDVALTYEEWMRSVRENTKFQTEYRLRRHDGEYRWHLARAMPHKDDSGNVIKWYGTTTDIHDQKLAEESLKLQARVLESMDEGVSVSDENGTILYTNAAEDRMFGYASGELIGKHVSVQNDYDRHENLSIVNNVLRQLHEKGFWNGEWRNRRKDGTHFYTYAHISALAIGDRKVFVCVQRDITQEREAKAVVDYQNKLIKTITDSASSALFMINDQGIATFMNPAGEHMFGYTPEEVAQKPLHDLIHYRYADGEAYPKEQCRIFKALQEKTPILPHEDWFYRKNGTSFPAVCSVNPIYEQGKPVASVVEVRDITAQKEAELILRQSAEQLEQMVFQRTQDLIRANEMLERSNRELEQYAYIASHDLQEPLRKIRTFTNMLLSKQALMLDGSTRSILHKVNASAERMARLITDLLNFSRITHTTEDRVPVNLTLIVNDILTDLELTIDQKGAEIQIGHLPTVWAAPLQMNQLFYNLLNNALKFTREGVVPRISVTSRMLTPEEGRAMNLAAGVNFFEIRIADNGIGFNQQYADQIFEIFKRLHDRQSYSGTGIGLALVRKIVLHHGGVIFATGTEGVGAQFHVILPEVHQPTRLAEQ